MNKISNKIKVMNKQRLLEDMQRGLTDSVRYFSDESRHDRESWIIYSFLENIGVQFVDEEITTPLSDPPDVTFRDSRFEIKEILDPGRRRHLEFKEQLKKAVTTKDPDDLVSAYDFVYDLSPLDILQLIEKDMERLINKYAPAVTARLDLLFYINLMHHTIRPDKMPDAQSLTKFGWRSVSALFGWAGLVYYASDTAPDFLQEKCGQLIRKKF